MEALLDALARGAARRRRMWGLAAGLALVLSIGAAEIFIQRCANSLLDQWTG